MLNATLWKRTAQALAAILVLSALLTATIALAGSVESKSIRANKGGVITIEEGIELRIPRGALEENTVISVKMVQNANKTTFRFEPHGLEFNIPVELWATKNAISDAESYVLYYALDEKDPDNYTEAIHADIFGGEVSWYLDHFSLYYYRRR
jgi:hypothetical protein